MDNSKYQQLLADIDVIKIGTCGGEFLTDALETVAIFFIFSHTGLSDSHSNIPQKRITLEVFPLENLIAGVRTKKINDVVQFMVNADISEYAFRFELSIKNNQISVKAIELPELGSSWLTDEELSGLSVTF